MGRSLEIGFRHNSWYKSLRSQARCHPVAAPKEKICETRERIAATKRRLAVLDQTEWMLRERIIEVDMETTLVKRKIAKIDQEIVNITKASARIPEIEIGTLETKFWESFLHKEMIKQK
ncbi:hypothetical protein H5410_026053 [Solanum commersonii]|uniref:Uncharacterized protein n=1 Tax=Solanum commersonii TaxID=4109 RepID=A0A9J5YVG5_SOLCO|nr:hypothetical protein H5410_026053 [Solanum commersonii]